LRNGRNLHVYFMLGMGYAKSPPHLPDPPDILRLLGIEALARYLADGVEDVYRKTKL